MGIGSSAYLFGMERIEYSQLNQGYEFPRTVYRIDSTMVADYLGVIGETNTVYRDTGLVPPMAVAALAMAQLSGNLSFPAGAIHVSQTFQFHRLASIQDSFTSCARVSRKHGRGKLRLMTIAIDVYNQKKGRVVSGETTFLLPASD